MCVIISNPCLHGRWLGKNLLFQLLLRWLDSPPLYRVLLLSTSPFIENKQPICVCMNKEYCILVWQCLAIWFPTHLMVMWSRSLIMLTIALLITSHTLLLCLTLKYCGVFLSSFTPGSCCFFVSVNITYDWAIYMALINGLLFFLNWTDCS